MAFVSISTLHTYLDTGDASGYGIRSLLLLTTMLLVFPSELDRDATNPPMHLSLLLRIIGPKR